MSNEIRNAIDAGLSGLCVTEGDVAAILQRVRAENISHPVRPKAEENRWRFKAALAVVMAALLAAAGLRLFLTGTPEARPLSVQDAATLAPEGFVPVEAVSVAISASEAIAIAEKHVMENCEGLVNLHDALTYEIDCEYTLRAAENAAWQNFYLVRFRALTAEATEYALRIHAGDGSVMTCDMQRGAQPGHTAQEIHQGYAREFGWDRRTWPQAQLRTYCALLQTAPTASLRWTDFLYLLSSYPNVAGNALSREEAISMVKIRLTGLTQTCDQDTGRRSVTGTDLNSVRARYIGEWPNPLWKVAVDQTAVNEDGYEQRWTLLAEVDSITGEITHVTAVPAERAEEYESFAAATIEAMMASDLEEEGPQITTEERSAIAAAYVRARWGETRDLLDETLFTLETAPAASAFHQCSETLTWRSLGGGETTEYVFWIDRYGRVVAANRSVTPAGQEPFTPTAPAIDSGWYPDELRRWQEKAAVSAQAQETEVRIFLDTAWLDEAQAGPLEDIQRAATAALGCHTTTRVSGVLIAAEPHNVWKLAMETDQGSFFVEVEEESCRVLSVTPRDNLWESWYLPYVLTSKLEAAGISLARTETEGLGQAAQGAGAGAGMRVDHVYAWFKGLYGPNMGQWTQAQLRTFREMAALSSDFSYDLAVLCLRHTEFPEAPAQAITPEEALRQAAAAIGQEAAGDDWRLCGAVLIGTRPDQAAAGTPVWKVCMQDGEGGAFWYAEVNCLTGEALRLHKDAEGTAAPGACYDFGTPENLWFRDIVLEETIEECEQNWVSRGHG